MAIRIPPRDYLTFAELQSSWKRDENSLRFAIICGALKPSVILNGTHKCLEWIESPSGKWRLSTHREATSAGQREIEPSGWQYLQEPIQTKPFDCQFKFASNHRDPEKSDITLSYWHSLPTTMTLEDVKESAVFLMKEIDSYSEKYGHLGSTIKIKSAEKPLPTTERNYLLKLVIGMAMKGYTYDPSAAKSTAIKEIADDLNYLGMSITDDTVRKYLKQAAATVLPGKQPKA